MVCPVVKRNLLIHSETVMQFVEANGAHIPAIGLGTMTLKEATCVETVAHALRAGYRYLYTGNEIKVGHGLKTSGVAREQVFVTTKVWHTNAAARDFARASSRRTPGNGMRRDARGGRRGPARDG
jgi:diketogulonate reductase-like aldo/keto reductase